MTYIIIGIFASLAAVGGFKGLFRRTGTDGIVAAIFLSVSVLLTLIPAVRLSPRAYLSIAGAFLMLMALASIFRKGSIGGCLYAVYISFLLGIGFYAVERWLIGAELTVLSRENLLLYALFVLTVAMFSENPRYAFPISVFSANVCSLLWWLNTGGTYFVFGTAYDAAITLFVFSAVIAAYLTGAVKKLYPKPKEIFVETADEISPETPKKVQK